MTPDEARAALGLTVRWAESITTIKAAFAVACHKAHPDKGGVGDVNLLQHARDVLLDELATINRACKLCSGVGKVRSTMGWRQCGACAGTGERR